MLDQVVRFAPILGPLIAAAIAVLGWYMAHHFIRPAIASINGTT